MCEMGEPPLLIVRKGKNRLTANTTIVAGPPEDGQLAVDGLCAWVAPSVALENLLTYLGPTLNQETEY